MVDYRDPIAREGKIPEHLKLGRIGRILPGDQPKVRIVSG
jgi:hypothetical protein